MQCSRRLFSMSFWSSGLTVCDSAVTQVVRKDRGRITPVRCVLARRVICKGERLCIVPESHILNGESAAMLLQQAAIQGNVASYTELQRRLATVSGDPSLLSTRDALLITLAVYVLKHIRVKHPLVNWATSLPLRVPPMGVSLLSSQAERASFEPLQRRLRIGEHTTALQSSDTNTAEASTELMFQAAEKDGLGNVGKPQMEVTASKALITAFYRCSRHPLTLRQQETFNAKHRNAESATTRHLLRLEESLRTAVLELLVPCVLPKGGVGSSEDDEAIAYIMEQLRWSHFILRSRAVNLNLQYFHQPQIAIVPFLDMLNHSVQDANVTYQYRPGVGVLIVASRWIKASEELTLNYGDYKQRGCLFSHASDGSVAAEGASAAMRRIELCQLREWSNDLHDDNIEEAPFGYGLQQQHNDATREGVDEETQTEATWLWRFGFTRSDEEKAYIASRLWSKGLRRRISQLTDVRRKGRPGEFVIGVPEGLRHLREQRERLERERFGGATVFPPQNM